MSVTLLRASHSPNAEHKFKLLGLTVSFFKMDAHQTKWWNHVAAMHKDWV